MSHQEWFPGATGIALFVNVLWLAMGFLLARSRYKARYHRLLEAHEDQFICTRKTSDRETNEIRSDAR